MKLLDKVYRFLALRPRSKKEIANYLKRKKTSSGETKKIFKILEQQGLVNDSVFAQWWIEQRTTFRPKGKIALMAELKQKGVNQEIIAQALREIDELALAKKAIAKRKFSSPQRLVNFLSYRGFSLRTIREVLEKKDRK